MVFHRDASLFDILYEQVLASPGLLPKLLVAALVLLCGGVSCKDDGLEPPKTPERVKLTLSDVSVVTKPR